MKYPLLYKPVEHHNAERLARSFDRLNAANNAARIANKLRVPRETDKRPGIKPRDRPETAV